MPTSGATPGDLTERQLIAAAGSRVFFGHQSVGANLLRAVPGVFAAGGVGKPPIGDPDALADTDRGFFAHAPIGANEQPLSKIEDFEHRIRAGLGARVNVAMMKLCYVDVQPDTDVPELFRAYRDVLAGLARDFPDVRVVATTVPLTTATGLGRQLTGKVRNLLGLTDQFGPAANLARQRLNELIRREFPGDRLFDLAAIESTTPEGDRITGRHGDHEYFALYHGYASDQGHLNRRGARAAAAGWLAAIARASSR